MENDLRTTYAGKRVFVTGHTGFKGSWLCRWLQRLDAEVIGFALAPNTNPSHHGLLRPRFRSIEGDIRNAETLAHAIASEAPEIVFHLAAQPLVRRSYALPLETFATNVQGTANVLEACRCAKSVRAIVVITTDKCYRNHDWAWGYRENDELGGRDPYSASKACAELVVASYRESFFRNEGVLVASARAGNVIGGGDWADDRLVPDLVKANSTGKPLAVRNPRATRPWQHVLDPLAGYLLLGCRLLRKHPGFAEAWNFGPGPEANLTVEEVVQRVRQYWPALAVEYPAQTDQPHEAALLMLDSTKARTRLGWSPGWPIDVALAQTAAWYRTFYETGNLLTDRQIEVYMKLLAGNQAPV